MALQRKLYGIWLSAPATTAALILEELEVEYEYVPVYLVKGEHKQPSFLVKIGSPLFPCSLLCLVEESTILARSETDAFKFCALASIHWSTAALSASVVPYKDLMPIPAFFHLVKNCPEFAELIEGRPNLKAWWQDVVSRPAWQKISKNVDAALLQMKERLQQQA